MQVTLNDWSMDAMINTANDNRLSWSAKGMLAVMQCGAARPEFDPNGSAEADAAYQELITYGYAHIK